jgi:hypothetical protein
MRTNFSQEFFVSIFSVKEQEKKCTSMSETAGSPKRWQLSNQTTRRHIPEYIVTYRPTARQWLDKHPAETDSW